MWHSPGQNTGVGSLSLLQRIFPNQGSSPGLPHCRWILYQLSHKRSPRILEWVAYSFASGSSWPRNQTGVSCIAGGFFSNRSLEIKWMHTQRTLLNKLWYSQAMKYHAAVKESACNEGDLGSIPGLVRSLREGKGYPLQYFGLENSMDCVVHGITESQTWLSTAQQVCE